MKLTGGERMELVLQVIFLVISVGIIASVLLQSGKSAGLSGAISGGAETFFGKKKGIDDILSKITVYLGVTFVIVSIVLTVLGG